jgi:hypothetical protein
MIYVRLNSFAFHRAFALGYRPLYQYEQIGLALVAMKRGL